jgi:hypothetical protein
MSNLFTQVIRRQALMMVPRRHESALLIAGPPANKVTNKVKNYSYTIFHYFINNFRKNYLD